MNHIININPDSKLLQYIMKFSKQDLNIILKESNEFIEQVKKEDKIHLEKMEKELINYNSIISK